MVGALFGAMPGTARPSTFIAYAQEKKIARHPERFGHGPLVGIAAPEASLHAKTQIYFISTISLGNPGDPMMALLLGALLIRGIQPGPRLLGVRADMVWGLIASFWIGKVPPILLNVPLIQAGVRVP